MDERQFLARIDTIAAAAAGIVKHLDRIATMLESLADPDVKAAIMAIERKLGVDNSDDPRSIDYRVRALEEAQP